MVGLPPYFLHGFSMQAVRKQTVTAISHTVISRKTVRTVFENNKNGAALFFALHRFFLSALAIATALKRLTNRILSDIIKYNNIGGHIRRVDERGV